MSRRAPRREYYEEDEIYEMERERERERYDRPRRSRHTEVDDEYFRRRSEPLAEDMERMHIHERPQRDFMEEAFAERERDGLVPRRSRGDMESDSDSLERRPRDHDERFMRKPRRRSIHRPREAEPFFEEWASHRAPRRYPLDIEQDHIIEEGESRRRRPERERELDVEDGLIMDERERRRERRHRPMRVFEEDLVPGRERERGGDRRRHSEPHFEDDPCVSEERYRSRRRQPRGFDKDDVILEDEPRGASRRRPERRSEDDLLFEKRDRRQHRRRPEREIEEDLWIEGPGKHRGKIRPIEGDLDGDGMAFRREGKHGRDLRRGWDSELDMRARDRSFEFEEEERYHRPRASSPRRVEVEEVLDIPLPQRRRGPSDRLKREIDDEEMITSLKDKGLRPIDLADQEEITIRERREKRRSPPPKVLEHELRGLRRGVRDESPVDVELGTRSQIDAKPSARNLDQIEEEISIRKPKEKMPSRPPSPLASIHVPPIHQDVFTHHRHIDHGFEESQPPRAPSPVLPSSSDSFDEIDIKHREMRGGRTSEHRTTLRKRDSTDTLAPEDSISPTSGPGIDFSDPWEREAPSAPRSLLKALDNEKEIPTLSEAEKEILTEGQSVENTARSVDDWSVIHAPSKEDAIEMTGALDVVEVEPRQAPVEEVKLGQIAQKVTEPKEARNDRWTEIAKKLVVREAIEEMDYEYEETRGFYYIFSYLTLNDIDDLVELSDEIRSARRKRIRDIQRERAASLSLPSELPREPRGTGLPARKHSRLRMVEKRMQDIRDRELMMGRW